LARIIEANQLAFEYTPRFLTTFLDGAYEFSLQHARLADSLAFEKFVRNNSIADANKFFTPRSDILLRPSSFQFSWYCYVIRSNVRLMAASFKLTKRELINASTQEIAELKLAGYFRCI